ncbi:MAG: molybdopterin-dependent oxidoreductase [Acidimicrobiales bacterium]
MNDTRTAFRTCPLCEAGCGLEITVKGSDVTRIRGDRDDVFSHGFICPKGSTLKQLHEDPDRLRSPLVKRDGRFVEATWDEAWSEVDRLLGGVLAEHGRDAVAVYLGNPSAHSLSPTMFLRPFLQAIGTRNRFSAATLDQMPRHVASGYVFGSVMAVPVPDLDRTDYLLMLGANPYASNGSLCTAPDFPGRLEALRARGGRLVVVDPRRSRTAEEADEWVAIRPGTDAQLLMAIVHTLFAEGLADAGAHVGAHLNGVDELRQLAEPFSPEAVAAIVGVDSTSIRRIARELAAAPTAAVYGRIGTCTQEFGTLASWLIDAVNILTGNLDRPGGAMFALPAAGGPTTRGTPGSGSGFRVGRGHTRVRGLPEVMGEYPASALAEEIDTPGEGAIRALITVAGNPVLSAPNSARLDKALGQLDVMIAVDIYLNETTRHADVILPPPSVLRRSHYDLLLLQFAVRNVANFSEPVFPLAPGQPDEWEILAKLALIAQGRGAVADAALVDEATLTALVEHAVSDSTSRLFDLDPDDVIAELSVSGRRGPERILDFMLRTGPYGLTLDDLIANPHGIDLGALEPRLPGVLRTPSGRIELAPAPLAADVARLASTLDRPPPDFVLVGRRNLRSNNSWMHNINVLTKGKPQCTLQIHPIDAATLGVGVADKVLVTSRVGELVAPVEITDGIREGVVSLPHGFGHDLDGIAMQVAQARPGVNSNLLSDEEEIDPLSGNAVLNGIPVRLARV